jgi:hypothetical protein
MVGQQSQSMRYRVVCVKGCHVHSIRTEILPDFRQRRSQLMAGSIHKLSLDGCYKINYTED